MIRSRSKSAFNPSPLQYKGAQLPAPLQCFISKNKSNYPLIPILYHFLHHCNKNLHQSFFTLFKITLKIFKTSQCRVIIHPSPPYKFIFFRRVFEKAGGFLFSINLNPLPLVLHWSITFTRI